MKASTPNVQSFPKKGHDFMTLKAAELFAVPPDKVTRDQRNRTKVWYHSDNYGAIRKPGEKL